MNKLLLVVLLAVCLVSVQAFVKRDAPAETSTDNYVHKLQKDLNEFGQNVGKTLKDTFDPDTLKKNFNEFVDKVNKAIDEIKPKQQQPAQ